MRLALEIVSSTSSAGEVVPTEPAAISARSSFVFVTGGATSTRAVRPVGGIAPSGLPRHIRPFDPSSWSRNPRSDPAGHDVSARSTVPSSFSGSVHWTRALGVGEGIERAQLPNTSRDERLPVRALVEHRHPGVPVRGRWVGGRRRWGGRTGRVFAVARRRRAVVAHRLRRVGGRRECGEPAAGDCGGEEYEECRVAARRRRASRAVPGTSLTDDLLVDEGPGDRTDRRHPRVLRESPGFGCHASPGAAYARPVLVGRRSSATASMRCSPTARAGASGIARPPGRSRDRQVGAARLRPRPGRRLHPARGAGRRERGRARLRRPHRAAATGRSTSSTRFRRAAGRRAAAARSRSTREPANPLAVRVALLTLLAHLAESAPVLVHDRRRAVGRRVVDRGARLRGPPPRGRAGRRGRDRPRRGADRARVDGPTSQLVLTGLADIDARALLATAAGLSGRAADRPAAGRGGQPARAARAAGGRRYRCPPPTRRRTAAGRSARAAGVPRPGSTQLPERDPARGRCRRGRRRRRAAARRSPRSRRSASSPTRCTPAEHDRPRDRSTATASRCATRCCARSRTTRSSPPEQRDGPRRARRPRSRGPSDIERRTWHRAAAALGPDEAVARALDDVARSAERRGALADDRARLRARGRA